MGSEAGEAGRPEQSAPCPTCAVSGPGLATSPAPTGLQIPPVTQGAQRCFLGSRDMKDRRSALEPRAGSLTLPLDPKDHEAPKRAKPGLRDVYRLRLWPHHSVTKRREQPKCPSRGECTTVACLCGSDRTYREVRNGEPDAENGQQALVCTRR